MFEELFDQDAQEKGASLFDEYIKHGDQYNIFIIDTNATKKEHSNTLCVVVQSAKEIKYIQM